MNGPNAERSRPQLKQAEERLLREVRAGLDHGFFELTVRCELTQERKRRFTIKAGKSHQFVIPEDDLRR